MNERLDRIVALHLEWGPERLRPFPERVREQMLQSHDDEFLPKYELEIEQYFRRLAEDPLLER